MTLEEIREKIDRLDTKMLEILAERMSLIQPVAEYKKKNNIPRYQPEREKEIMDSRRKIAEKLSINPELVENLTKLVISDAHRIERDIMGE
jgi:chorismate mutase